MERINSSYQSLDGAPVAVSFTTDLITTEGGKEIIVCDNEKYEMRLIKSNSEQDPSKNSKIIYNAQITNKASGIIIHAPVVMVTGGESAGAVMIGSTANFKKHRALLRRYVSPTQIYDEVTMPYQDYMIVETMLKTVCANQ